MQPLYHFHFFQPVPASSRNSEISGYMLEYTPYGLAPNTVSIGNADILTTNIRYASFTVKSLI